MCYMSPRARQTHRFTSQGDLLSIILVFREPSFFLTAGSISYAADNAVDSSALILWHAVVMESRKKPSTA